MKNAKMNIPYFRFILFNLQILGKIGWSQPICNTPATIGLAFKSTSLSLVEQPTSRFFVAVKSNLAYCVFILC